MSTPAENLRLGPNGKPVRPFVMPADLRGRLRVYRFTIARRATQIGVLLLFFGTVNWEWQVFGQPVLTGNLSSSELAGVIPFSDPFAAVQILLTGHALETTALIGALLVLLIWAMFSGRTWCAWACPINMVTDAADSLRTRLGVRDLFHLRRGVRYIVMVMALVLSVLTGVAAFEWISPISLFHRELIFGIGLGWTAVLGIFVFDLFLLRNGWCGHLCPLGAFYSLVGRVGQVRVDFDTPTCTHCGECARVCPEPQVLHLKKASEAGLIASGECTNCGQCIPVCPEDTLAFNLRPLIQRHQNPENQRKMP